MSGSWDTHYSGTLGPRHCIASLSIEEDADCPSYKTMMHILEQQKLMTLSENEV